MILLPETREEFGLAFEDKDILENPYQIFEQTRHTVDPSHQERLDHVNKSTSKDMFQSDKLASTLFINLEELNKNASVRLYRESLGLQFEKDDLIPTSQFDTSSNPTQGTVDIDTSFF